MSQFKTANAFNTTFTVNNELITELLNYVNAKGNHHQLTISNKQLVGVNLILKSLIGRNLFDKDGYYPNLNENDNCVLKAIQVLKK